MLGMGEEFRDHAKQWNVEPELVQTLMGSSLDVEYLIEALDRICTARSSLDAIGQPVAALDKVDKIRAEVEWFVQHVAERVVAKDARLMWGAVLRAAASMDLTLVTTNYDRAIELAANAEGIELDDGFGAFDQDEIALWRGFDPNGGDPLLIKLHGSTDWYAKLDSGSPVKLRHPMPLFGRARLRVAETVELGSALVLPSREKLLTHSPYPRLSQAFLNAADSCELAIVVGSSLRDLHIRGATESMARRIPVFLVNPSGNTYELAGVRAIRQCASTFLIATLPLALAKPDVERALEAISTDSYAGKGILGATSRALDADATSELRCRALEELDDMGLTLDPFLLRQLLADDDAIVARYTLGLISRSSQASQLVAEASSTKHAEGAAFKADLQLLGQILTTEATPVP